MSARTPRPTDSSDDGYTMVELAVGMVILSIFLAVFAGAMVSTFHSVYRTQQTSYAQSQVNIVFGKLDRELHDADGIAPPAFVNGEPVVEFSDSSSGTQVCTALRLTSTGTLMERSWTSLATLSTTKPSVLATDVQAQNTGVNPFTFTDASATADHQQLQIQLQARQSSQVAKSDTRDRHMDVTFTALNTDLLTDVPTACTAGRSVAWAAP